MNHTHRNDQPPAPARGGPTRVALHTPVPGALGPEIERRLYFVSPRISGFALVGDGDTVTAVDLTTRAPCEEEGLEAKVNRMVDNDVRPQMPTRPKSVWTSPHERAADGDTFERLAAAGAVAEVGEGQVAVGEPLLSLFAYFDRAVLGILAQDHSAREFRYPTLIRTSTLERAGYFTSFPQHLMFVTRLHNDIDVYRSFQESYPRTGIGPSVLQSCGNVDYCLPPTMCYHTFAQYGGRALEGEGLHVVTSRGKSFRFEAGYSTTLERLWDFTIREIVFLGSREDVARARERYMRKVFAFLEELGLSGWCEVGNDPFFSGSDASARIWSQRLQELKYELRLPVGPDRSIAVGSFNFHDDLFGRAFDITRGEGPAHSGCVGFGLERLVFAFLSQFGTDEQDWPDPVRTGVRAAGGI
ncbi:hypothetical protein OUQ99_18290 [Streptomonospora nanhaiensis]|uniref:Aminoacyl-transfer RNA synthetases class-II family profile domain-containing protein n=1 Tax=Streptomonospora nanhaiensis TaxID=1323731 RepID=A0ABY6YG05_9ACTN|nr:hypothetical protein [Streptomonospora nanhaiensis]WAE71180.1 hypothetical protein OUQ99_18290 [Streptomonospora nanhaiensis]